MSACCVQYRLLFFIYQVFNTVLDRNTRLNLLVYFFKFYVISVSLLKTTTQEVGILIIVLIFSLFVRTQYNIAILYLSFPIFQGRL